jgi:hypothetical protein
VLDVACDTVARLSANARGRAVSLRWAAVSRAVDQSSLHNKRNDRLAEGHDRLAGAAMMLCMHSDRALLIGVCHCFFDSLGTFRRGRSLSDR